MFGFHIFQECTYFITLNGLEQNLIPIMSFGSLTKKESGLWIWNGGNTYLEFMTLSNKQ